MQNKSLYSILIVDDEAHIRILLHQTLEELEDEDVEILVARNGEEALRMIREEIPELVFLDVMMPLMNGYEVCQKTKNDLKLSQVYIVMLTAKGQVFDKQKGEDVGANVYMTKPFNPDDILKKAREVVGL